MNGLTTHRETEKSRVTHFVDIFQAEDWNLNTSNVFLSHSHAYDGYYVDMINDSSTEVSCGEYSLSHSHARLAVVNSHTNLGLDDFEEDSTEGFF